MNIVLTPKQPTDTSFSVSCANTNASFHEAILNDEELNFLLDVFIKSMPIQLERFDELYIYDELEMGDLFEELSERTVTLSLSQAKELLKVLAKYSFYREEAYHLHKVCQGHSEIVKGKVLPKDVEKVEREILSKWKEKKEIKKITTQKDEHSGLFWKKYYSLSVDYTHIDNYPECSYSSVKKWVQQNLPFLDVIEKFENKIKTHHLNQDLEWSKLIQRVFKDRINLVT